MNLSILNAFDYPFLLVLDYNSELHFLNIFNLNKDKILMKQD
jgi:hypothetical protein